MQLINQLNIIISEHHLLKHTYYQAWSKGELSREDLQCYAAQYYKQVDSFPRFISSVHANCPIIKVRKELLKNLLDEEGDVDHPTLWRQFGEGLGVTQEQMLNDTLLPETKTMVDTYYDLAKRDWRDGLCALYAYEYQVPEVSASKIAGLKQFYDISDDRTLEFFTAHQVYDVEHSKQVASLIEEYVEPEQAMRATCEAAKVLWGFLDGMCRIRHISCEN